MFSGIVTALGRVESVPVAFQGELVIRHPSGWGDLRIGDSLAVNGCCLTLVRQEGDMAAVEVMPETMRRTNLGLVRRETLVNLEADAVTRLVERLVAPPLQSNSRGGVQRPVA